ncbi:MAG: PEGA domain-containing protein [bacterium]
MKRLMSVVCVMTMGISCMAAPLKVALLDFNDETGMKADALLGGKVQTDTLAKKGAYILARQLLEKGEFNVIDRRDFTTQVEKFNPKDALPGQPRPSFIHAAQILNADAVVGGSLISLSTGKTTTDQGGYKAEFTTLSLRVMVRAMDSIDGSVVAVAEGAARQEFRQTDNLKTELGEDEILTLFDKAIGEAVAPLKAALAKKIAVREQQPRLQLSVKTTSDPAMVEIDGVLVGTTPMEGLEVYKGDHVMTISRPGHVTITKRIMMEKNVQISAPMLRTDLTADEKKEILSKAEIKAYMMNGKPDLLIQTIE